MKLKYYDSTFNICRKCFVMSVRSFGCEKLPNQCAGGNGKLLGSGAVFGPAYTTVSISNKFEGTKIGCSTQDSDVLSFSLEVVLRRGDVFDCFLLAGSRLIFW